MPPQNPITECPVQFGLFGDAPGAVRDSQTWPSAGLPIAPAYNRGMAATKPTNTDASPETELQALIGKFTPEIATLARACLKKMRAKLPGAVQLVYDNYNALAIGFCPSSRASEAIFSIVLYPRWVTLFFLQGAGLPDPDKLLKGNGKIVRHIVLAAAADLDKPAIRALMSTALNRAKAPLDPTAAGYLEIRAIAPKQRPRRPEKA